MSPQTSRLRPDRAAEKAARIHMATITKRGKSAAKFQAFTVSQLFETYRDPRAVLMEIAGTDTATLAKQCDCSLLDALQERRLAALSVLPYVAQKLPVQVDMRHTKAIHLNIVTTDQYDELVTIAETDDPAATNHVQLIQGQVIEATDDAPTTASGLQPETDAHLHAEQSADTANGTSPAITTQAPGASGVDESGLGLDEDALTEKERDHNRRNP